MQNENDSAFMSRLSTYNTSSPINFDVDFLIYIEDNDLIENNIKARFKRDINPVNKEWLKGVELSVIIDYIKSFCDLTFIEYKVVIDKCKNITNEDHKVEELNEVLEENKEDIKVEVEDETEDDKIEDETEDDKLEEEIEDKDKDCEEKDKEIKSKYQCKDCKKFNVGEKRAERCVDCNRISSRKVTRPSYEQLVIDSKNMSIVAIGKKYGVSDNAIRKWINIYKKKS